MIVSGLVLLEALLGSLLFLQQYAPLLCGGLLGILLDTDHLLWGTRAWHFLLLVAIIS